MKKHEPFTVLDDIAKDYIPDNTNLTPRLAARLERKSLMLNLRTRPMLAMLIALFVLLALSGAAYALGWSLGYFPGLGVVKQDAPFYVMTAPVSQTRDGITVTVQQAIMNTDQMSVAFTVENIPADKQSGLILPDSRICMSHPELQFSNGEIVKIYGGATNPLKNGYESQYKFTSIPLNILDATLYIPCIQGALEPGLLPENWEIPMHFIPAPPQVAMTTIPMMMDIPVSQATIEPASTAEIIPTSVPATSLTNSLSILQVIDTGDRYILVGAFAPPASPANEQRIYTISDIILSDGNGQVVADEEFPFDLDLTPYILAYPGKDVWAVRFTENFVPPLRISYQTRYIYSPMPQQAYTFEFNAGTSPQAGQEWNLNRKFQLAGHNITLSKITAGVNSLTFFFHTDDESIESLGMYSVDAIQIEGYTPIDFGGWFGIGNWSLTKTYSELPKGKLNITISGLYLYGEFQDWTLEWQP
jgi:hypothetical protein